jgi:hypothetical protein
VGRTVNNPGGVPSVIPTGTGGPTYNRRAISDYLKIAGGGFLQTSDTGVGDRYGNNKWMWTNTLKMDQQGDRHEAGRLRE